MGAKQPIGTAPLPTSLGAPPAHSSASASCTKRDRNSKEIRAEHRDRDARLASSRSEIELKPRMRPARKASRKASASALAAADSQTRGYVCTDEPALSESDPTQQSGASWEDSNSDDNSTLAPSSNPESDDDIDVFCGLGCCCRRCQARWNVWKDAVRLSERQPLGYRDLCDRENQWSTMIRTDTPRTFPEIGTFGSHQKDCLYRILNAYANHNPEVGYCQGMNFVAGLLILVSDQDEDDTFGVFVCLMDDYGLAGFYDKTFSLLSQYVNAFEAAMLEVSPLLAKHLEEQGMQPFLYLHEWFLTLFINCVPIPAALAIWDVVMTEGLHVLVTVAVSILQALEATILSLRFEDIHQFYKSLKKAGPSNGDSIAKDCAFEWLMDRSCYTQVPPHILESLCPKSGDETGTARIGFRKSTERVSAAFSAGFLIQRSDSINSDGWQYASASTAILSF